MDHIRNVRNRLTQLVISAVRNSLIDYAVILLCTISFTLLLLNMNISKCAEVNSIITTL